MDGGPCAGGGLGSEYAAASSVPIEAAGEPRYKYEGETARFPNEKEVENAYVYGGAAQSGSLYAELSRSPSEVEFSTRGSADMSYSGANGGDDRGV